MAADGDAVADEVDEAPDVVAVALLLSELLPDPDPEPGEPAKTISFEV